MYWVCLSVAYFDQDRSRSWNVQGFLADRHSTVSVSIPVCISCRLRTGILLMSLNQSVWTAMVCSLTIGIIYWTYHTRRDMRVNDITGSFHVTADDPWFVPSWKKVHKRMLPISGRGQGMALIVRKTKTFCTCWKMIHIALFIISVTSDQSKLMWIWKFITTSNDVTNISASRM